MKTDMGTTGDHQIPLFPHEISEWSPWSPVVPANGDRGPRVSPPKGGPQGSKPSGPTKHFTAHTCPKCGHITITGLWVGLRIDLEPQVLTDLDEYHAIRDGVKTWNLYRDRTAQPRCVARIRSHEVTDRHAQHSCGHTYGTQTPTPRTTATTTIPDEPAF